MVEQQPGVTFADAGLAVGGLASEAPNPFESPEDGEGERIRGGVATANVMPSSRSSSRGPPPPRPPRAPERLRASMVPDPAAWLSGKDVPAVTIGAADVRSGTPSRMGGMGSSEGHGSDPFADSSGSDMGHTAMSSSGSPQSPPYASGSGSDEASRISGAGMYIPGPGSSAHGHSSGSAQGHTGSSSGHGASSSSLGHQRMSASFEGRRSPGPSSLLPTQSPPTAFRGVGRDDDEGRSARRRSSFIDRPLKWVRGKRPGSTSSMHSGGSSSRPPLTTAQISAPRIIPDPPTPTVPTNVQQGPSSGSLGPFRQQSPTLSTLPPAAFVPFRATPNTSVPHGVPVWPGLGSLARPDMPSPALTEQSSTRAPEGLLDPSLGAQWGDAGMASTAAISLRDDVDYSRPIGAVPGPPSRSSWESDRSEYLSQPEPSPPLISTTSAPQPLSNR